MPENQFSELSYPPSRRLTFDLGKVGLAKHHVHALLEVDVTDARQRIRQIRRDGIKVSFFTWLIKVIADCVALHPSVAGFNLARKNRVLVFNDVDVSIMVEKDVNGVRVPLPYVVRKAEQKTLNQIHDEIERAKTQIVENEGNYVLGQGYSAWGMKLFLHLPQWLRIFLMRVVVLDHPQRAKSMMGNVMLTTAGMIGHPHGWIMPFGMHPLCFALGSITEQPAVHRGEIQKREILHLTILIDHEVVDGMPAARFVDDLVKKIEAGSGLEA
jgi:pyruvate/2-oxoglutarate dehydrogenase complex dihydrolipoamide acyltransferase (E2) component